MNKTLYIDIFGLIKKQWNYLSFVTLVLPLGYEKDPGNEEEWPFKTSDSYIATTKLGFLTRKRQKIITDRLSCDCFC